MLTGGSSWMDDDDAFRAEAEAAEDRAAAEAADSVAWHEIFAQMPEDAAWKFAVLDALGVLRCAADHAPSDGWRRSLETLADALRSHLGLPREP